MTASPPGTIETAPVAEDPLQLPTLFGTTDPGGIIKAARGVASALSRVVDDLNLTVPISGRKYVLLEGWTLLGSMVGVFAEVEWSRPIPDGEGWEARAVARTLSGRVVGAAEALCSRSEDRWRNRPDHQLRSMAQTRAVSKALRLPLGFIVEMGGYSATPADEMDEPTERPARRSAPPGGSVGDMRQRIHDAAKARGMTSDQLLLIANEQGVAGEGRPTIAQLRRILAAVEEYPLVGEPDELPV